MYTANMANDALRNAKQIYDCSAECSRCAPTIKTIIDEAFRECALACQAGYPHRQITDVARDEPKVTPATL